MKMILALLLNCSMLPAFAQSDSMQQKAPGLTADDQVTFVTVQQVPNYKNGISALADLLTEVLVKNKEMATCKMLIGYKLRITNKGIVDNVSITMSQNNNGLDTVFLQALLATSGMWDPARQNGQEVNAFKSLIITIFHHKINIKEFY